LPENLSLKMVSLLLIPFSQVMLAGIFSLVIWLFYFNKNKNDPRYPPGYSNTIFLYIKTFGFFERKYHDLFSFIMVICYFRSKTNTCFGKRTSITERPSSNLAKMGRGIRSHLQRQTGITRVTFNMNQKENKY